MIIKKQNNFAYSHFSDIYASSAGHCGSRIIIKARQRSVARQIKSTLPGFYSDKLAPIYTPTHTLTYTLTQTLNHTLTHTLTYTPMCRATICCPASIRLSVIVTHIPTCIVHVYRIVAARTTARKYSPHTR